MTEPTVSKTSASRARDDRAESGASKAARFHDRVFFASGSATFSPDAQAKLDRDAKWLAKNTDKQISIVGHTNTVGSADLNQALSERRAEAVKEYLTQQGVDESRMSTVGFGAQKPEFKPGRSSKNRRVVIVIK